MTTSRRLACVSLLLGSWALPARAQLCYEFDTPLTAANNTVDLLVVDLDGDGDRDLAVASSNGSVSIFIASAPRSFVGPSTVPVSSGATAIAGADVDGDLDVDLVLSNATTNAVTVLQNNGNGTFANAVDWPLSAPGTSVGCADIDGDGDVDVMATLVPSGIAVLRNQGSGTFAAPTVLGTAVGPYGLVCADFDGDADVDLAWTLAAPSAGMQYVSNLGAGTFAAPLSGSTGADPIDMVLVDLEPDGDLDLVTCDARFQTSSGSFSLVRNLGSGLFQSGGSTTVPSFHPTSIGAGDVTGDGVPEIVLGGSALFVYRFTGVGYAPFTTISTGNPVIGVNVVDLDGDGARDLVCAAPLGLVNVFYNAGGGSFPVSDGQAVGAGPVSLAAGDFDADGHVDVAVLNRDGNSVSILLNPNDSLPLAAPVNYPMGNYPRSVLAADLSGDGRLDLAAAASGDDLVHVRFGGLGGVFGSEATYGTAPIGDPIDLAAADLDGDGDLDLAVANTSGGIVSVLRNNGSGSFLTPLQLPTSTLASLVNVKAGDMDGDGDVDLVAGGASSNQIYVLLNSGAGTFAPAAAYSAPLGVGGMTLADFDADGDLDAIVAMGSGILKLANDGSGALGPQVVISAPLQGIPYGGQSILLADLDADGDLDVLTPNSYSSVVFRLENLGGGVLATPTQVPVGLTPSALAGLDFDGDGDVDLACANTTSNSLSMVRNCDVSGVTLCVGDGSGTACPCGNASPLGSGAGCANSLGLAGKTTASGAARLSQDALVLRASGMPNGGALFFQGSVALNGGNGVPFDDGLRCAGGSVVRLAVKVNVGGASTYPGQSDPPIRVRGGVIAPGARFYQVWYRDNAPFCGPALSSTTNGVRVDWRP